MIKVFLQEKKLKHGKLGLYLDFYPTINIPTRRNLLELTLIVILQNRLRRVNEAFAEFYILLATWQETTSSAAKMQSEPKC
jgi:hypothetical protein